MCRQKVHTPSPAAWTCMRESLEACRTLEWVIPPFPWPPLYSSHLFPSCLSEFAATPCLGCAPMVTSCAVGRHERLDQVQAFLLAQSQTWEVRFIFPTALAEEVWVHNEKKKKGTRGSVTEGSCGSHSLSGVRHRAHSAMSHSFLSRATPEDTTVK